MATLLQMLNRTRELLRSGDSIATIPSGNFEVDTHIALINGAAHDVLEGRDWTFDEIDNGVVYFYAPYTGTDLDTTFTGQVTGEVQIDQTTNTQIPVNVTGTNISANGGSSGSATGAVSRLVIEEDTEFPNFSYRVANIDTDATDKYALLLEPHNRGDAFASDAPTSTTAGSNWTLYSNQAVIPSSVVRSIVEIRNEDDPLTLEFISRIHELREWIPRDLWQQGDPEIAVFGGQVSSTTTASATAVTGHALTIWPVPSINTMLRYSYMRNHAELAADADTFAGVPDRIFDAIVWRTVQNAFATTERNTEQAQAAGAVFGQKIAQAVAADEKMPSRTRDLRPFDATPRGGVNPRWNSAQVPAA